jgi:hypothetical protein
MHTVFSNGSSKLLDQPRRCIGARLAPQLLPKHHGTSPRGLVPKHPRNGGGEVVSLEVPWIQL